MLSLFYVSLVHGFFSRPTFNTGSSVKVEPKVPEITKEVDTNSIVVQQNVLEGETGIPNNGIIDYIGNTLSETRAGEPRWETDYLQFVPPSPQQVQQTRFNLFRQWPWKKISGKVVLKAKVGGSLALESEPPRFSLGSTPDFEPVDTLEELIRMLTFGAYDPRVKSILIEIDRIEAGYAKLAEVKRFIKFFQQSGKKVYGYCSAGSEKEFYLGLACDELYVPPDGGLDLRGFSAAATFVRGVFNKIGIEPQVQRIGKYKSFGDTFNRTEIAEAQREVVSSLLMEASEFWADSVADSLNLSVSAVKQLWVDEGIKDIEDFRKMGYVTGVRYLDQVEDMIKSENREEVNMSFMDEIFVTTKQSNINATLPDANFSTTESTFYSALNITKTKLEDRGFLTDFNTAEDFDKYPRRSLDSNFSWVSAESEKVFIERNETAINEARNKTLESIQKHEGKKEKELESTKKFFEYKLKSSEPSFMPAGLYLRKMRKGAKIIQGLRLREALRGERVGVINAIGGIAPGKSGNGPTGKTVGSDSIIALLRRAKKDPGIKAVVLRIDSPGGSALASDLMWREIRALARDKPIIASMVDVAASGGYYMSMACDQIFAEELTVTGSIGVVTSKFNLEELNDKLGFGSETISRGRYAEVLSSSRGFTQDEADYFEAGAWKAYLSFTTKAAMSRGMSRDAMQEVAQGRVWTGRQALRRGLVDRIGGLWAAVRAASYLAELDIDKKGLIIQVLKEPKSPFASPFGIGGRSASTFYDDNDVYYSMDDAVAYTDLVSADSLGVPSILKKTGLASTVGSLLQKYKLGDIVQQPAISLDSSRLGLLLEDVIDDLTQ